MHTQLDRKPNTGKPGLIKIISKVDAKNVLVVWGMDGN